jgi:ABC-type bacteriocin/lantibiotic exporter with double-glycine peptidase domain
MFRNTTEFTGLFKKILALLDSKQKLRMIFVLFVQVLFSILDILGIALIGLIAALTVSALQWQSPKGYLQEILQILRIEDLSIQGQVLFLALTSTMLLVIKTITSVFLARKTTFYLMRTSFKLSGELFSRVLNSNLTFINRDSISQLQYSITSGVERIMVGILGSLVNMISDLVLLALIITGLAVVDPIIAILSLSGFSIIGITIYYFLSIRAKYLGLERARLEVANQQLMREAFVSFRELFVRYTGPVYARKLVEKQLRMADVAAEIAFMPQVSKYIMEISIVVVAMIVAGQQFFFNEAKDALSVLSVFLMASLRIAPAILRIQQSFVLVRTNLSSALPTLSLVDEIRGIEVVGQIPEYSQHHLGFVGDIQIDEVSFRYPNSIERSIENCSLRIPEGAFCAIVGPSGAGKSTLVDLMLGIQSPEKGKILISGLSPKEAVTKWPGAISYSPQSTTITDGTVRENIVFGFQCSEEDAWLLNAITTSQLTEFVEERAEGLQSTLGDAGNRISGGQRQRLGIARALFTNPKVLVLDEATSALDSVTESLLQHELEKMKKTRTLVVIAHRLSTVKKADLIIYMDKGKILTQGTFAEVRAQIPEFERQAGLLGIAPI